ncbi:hypothetical protein [Paenibacillus sp. CF384]|uniref:hypothetical protein n=1 Tax=Paenibacillus sp. CF384 TaxID=1884382 RepID=UPI00089789BA|nr:hypothetical protein [Paenibacillus sp. CF384]SDX96474.1 Galactose mutarotase [Paenibacillus sp. CF384]
MESRCIITHTTYQDWPAVLMESTALRITIIPELGGKIVSLENVLTGKEWIVGTGARPLAKVEHGSDFLAADMSGWDECFPTVAACTYPLEGANFGQLMPDHGDVWSIPWEVSFEEQDALVCKVVGRALPYELTRTIRFESDQQLRFEYTVRNLSSETLAAFWLAHPQFVATANTRIMLPGATKQVRCVYGGGLLQQGELYDWPETVMDGSKLRLDTIGPSSAKDARKFYIDGAVDEGWTGLYEQDSEDYLKLEWDAESVPYLGIWIDEGLCNEQAVCALEPCNGYYDSLTEAVGRDKLLRIAPHSESEWHLSVKLGSGPMNTK